MRTLIVLSFLLAISMVSIAQERFPRPAHADAVWKPEHKTRIKDWYTATNLFIEKTGADPRALDYREVELQMGSIWKGDAGTHRTHAWVYYAKGNSSQPYALTWNGQLYPALWVGDKAELEADIRKLDTISNNHALDLSEEHYMVDHRAPLTPSRLALLVRLGKEDLVSMKPASWWRLEGELSQYLIYKWMDQTYERGMMAHMRGDDSTALHCFSHLKELREWTATSPPANWSTPDDISHFANVNQLYRDHQRRAKRSVPYFSRDCGQIEDDDKRLRAMIKALENVDGKMAGQPGGVMFSFQDDVKAFVHEGRNAIPYLIECQAKDKRLSRTVSFWRDFVPMRDVFSVASVAEIIIEEILGIYHDDLPNQDHSCKNIDAACRAKAWEAYWKQNENLSAEEERFHQLEDQSLAATVWIDAAEFLTVDGPKPQFYTSLSPANMLTQAARDTLSFNGDKLPAALRTKLGKVITDRISDLASKARRESSSYDAYQYLYDAVSLLKSLHRWQPTTSKPTIDKLYETTYTLYLQAATLKQRYRFGYLISSMTLYKVELGDEQALERYHQHVKSWSSDYVAEDYLKNQLTPLAVYANHPEMRTLADWLFLDPASPLLQLVDEDPVNATRLFNGRNIPAQSFMDFISFRDWVLALLGEETIVTEATFKPDGYHHRGGPTVSTSGGVSSVEWGYPTETATQSLRVCDWIAKTVGGFEGTDAMILHLNQSERDSIIANQVLFMRRYGQNIESKGFRYYELELPTLGMPAEEDDVMAGAAIFSFPPTDSVRYVSRASIPDTMVTWFNNPKLKEYYNDGRTRALGEGKIWQIEERWEEDHWERYYGVVGRRYTARLQSHQLEANFANTGYDWSRSFAGRSSWVDGWKHLPEGLNARLDRPSAEAWGQANPNQTLTADQALWINCYFTSRRLSGSALRPDWLNQTIDTENPLPAGITVTLERTEAATIWDENVHNKGHYLIRDEVQWKKVKSTFRSSTERGSKVVALPYRKATPGLSFNLRDHYRLLPEGYYRLSISLSEEDEHLGNLHEIYFYLE